MQLKGSHNFNAPAATLWQMLMDTDTLTRVTPGISRLEEIDTDLYKAIADIKMGPVNGSFEGQLQVAEKNEPENFTLRIKQDSKIGNVNADVMIHLKPVSEAVTEMSFDGKANLSGLLARTGQRVLGGVAKALSKQFFKAMEDELQTQTGENNA